MQKNNFVLADALHPTPSNQVESAAPAQPDIATQNRPEDEAPTETLPSDLAEAHTATEDNAPRRSGRIRSMPKPNYRGLSPKRSETSASADEDPAPDPTPAANPKSIAKRKLAEVSRLRTACVCTAY